MTPPRLTLPGQEDPTICPPNRATVWIRHAYHTSVVLIALSALERTSDGEWGVDHQLALDACLVLSQNRPGFLASTSSRDTRIDLEVAVLTATEYFYHLEVEGFQYPIVSEFDAWEPAAPPAHWYTAVANCRTETTSVHNPNISPSNVSDYVKGDDGGKCAISGFPAFVRNVQLVPKSHEAWFKVHNQYQYNANSTILLPDDISNGITLRADLQIALDSCSFVFAPSAGRIVVYFLTQVPVYTSLYHAIQIAVPGRISINHLYSRFAYNVIKRSPQVALAHSGAQVIPVPAGLQQPKTNIMQRIPTSAPSHANAADVQDRPNLPDLKTLKSEWFSKNPQIWQTSSSEDEQEPPIDDLLPLGELLGEAAEDAPTPPGFEVITHVEADDATGHTFYLSDLRLPESDWHSKTRDWRASFIELAGDSNLVGIAANSTTAPEPTSPH